MTLEEIKLKIQSSEYDFLWINEHLGNNIMFLTLRIIRTIRNEKYTYDEIFEMTSEFEKKVDYAKRYTELPEEADFKKVEELVMEINKMMLRRNS